MAGVDGATERCEEERRRRWCAAWRRERRSMVGWGVEQGLVVDEAGRRSSHCRGSLQAGIGSEERSEMADEERGCDGGTVDGDPARSGFWLAVLRSQSARRCGRRPAFGGGPAPLATEERGTKFNVNLRAREFCIAYSTLVDRQL